MSLTRAAPLETPLAEELSTELLDRIDALLPVLPAAMALAHL